jgi:hypothetical protein
MVFEGNFKDELTSQLIAAISFALEADADVEIDEDSIVRKVIKTTTHKFHGQFAANDLFGEFYGNYSEKDGVNTLSQMMFKFGGSDTESIVKCVSNQTLLSGIGNAYAIFNKRKEAQPKIYPALVKLLDKIEKMAPDTKPITEEIKSMFGTDIELVDTIPAEKEG